MNKNITAILLIILAVGIYFTVTTKILDSAGEVSKQNDRYLAALESAKQLISIRDKVTNDYNNISQDDRDKLDKMIPSSVDNIRLIIDLNNVAVQNGFILKNIKVTVPSATQNAAPKPSSPSSPILPPTADTSSTILIPSLDTVNISFDVSASYQQFIGLLQALESNLRLMDLTHLSVTANDSGMYEYHVDLRTYWLRQ
jgi:Tfp pilus assembly protein PilO